MASDDMDWLCDTDQQEDLDQVDEAFQESSSQHQNTPDFEAWAKKLAKEMQENVWNASLSYQKEPEGPADEPPSAHEPLQQQMGLDSPTDKPLFPSGPLELLEEQREADHSEDKATQPKRRRPTGTPDNQPLQPLAKKHKIESAVSNRPILPRLLSPPSTPAPPFEHQTLAVLNQPVQPQGAFPVPQTPVTMTPQQLQHHHYMEDLAMMDGLVMEISRINEAIQTIAGRKPCLPGAQFPGGRLGSSQEIRITRKALRNALTEIRGLVR
ncbi:hypothetical protein F53441_12740 [Fusarium austroafricanum]|uniref:Uncharacterized protein n=1 Tax=Fusarium austroafricanum TaxID=2364996 RepID=A0A8H4JTE3_9HYPO|nr:hypothetical protein F53441_12740 [Fusarium austroafricanum]